MKPMVITGILLFVLGIIALSYNRITYTKEEKIAEIGPFTATAERQKIDSAAAGFRRFGFDRGRWHGRGGLPEVIAAGEQPPGPPTKGHYEFRIDSANDLGHQ